mmetsp:Transcript_61104/g.149605  ORF Transcript_61104/g.149605 Transcript_61104/m.149605 type:complete len:87 (-) Transcript_61104:362-622(-)
MFIIYYNTNVLHRSNGRRPKLTHTTNQKRLILLILRRGYTFDSNINNTPTPNEESSTTDGLLALIQFIMSKKKDIVKQKSSTNITE